MAQAAFFMGVFIGLVLFGVLAIYLIRRKNIITKMKNWRIFKFGNSTKKDLKESKRDERICKVKEQFDQSMSDDKVIDGFDETFKDLPKYDENSISPSGVYHNIEGHNFESGPYHMQKHEADAILPLLKKYKEWKLSSMKNAFKKDVVEDRILDI